MRPIQLHELFRKTCSAAAIAGIGVALSAAPSFAQDGDKAPPPAGEKPTGGDGVGGPTVPPDAKEGDGDFGGAGKPGRRPGGPGGERGMDGAQGGARAWIRTFEEMKPSLSEEQRTKAEGVQKEFKDKADAWKETNGEQVKQLADQMRSTAQSGGKPDKALLEQMQKLNSTRPKMEAMQPILFAMLTPEQQGEFKTRFEEMKKKMAEQGAMRQGGKGGGPGSQKPGSEGGQGDRKRGKGGKGGDAPSPPPPPADGDGNAPPPPMDE